MKSYESTQAKFVTLHKAPFKKAFFGFLRVISGYALLFFVTFDTSIFQKLPLFWVSISSSAFLLFLRK